MNKKINFTCAFLGILLFFAGCDEKTSDDNFIFGHWGLKSIDGIDFKELKGYQNNSFYFHKDKTVSLPYKDYFKRERNAAWKLKEEKRNSTFIQINSKEDKILDNTFEVKWIDKENYVIKLISDRNVMVIQKINIFFQD